jgi:hypothetical protein
MKIVNTIVLLAVVIVTGCHADPGAPAPRAAGEINADAASLAGRGLAGSSLPEMRLIATARGRDLLSRVVSCALPSGAAITAIAGDGTPYSFAGALGLAPDWARHAPSRDQHRRVTECVRAQTIRSTPA